MSKGYKTRAGSSYASWSGYFCDDMVVAHPQIGSSLSVVGNRLAGKRTIP